MRVDFTKAVAPLLHADERSVFVTGDLGYNALEPLRADLGRRFLNAGVAEQNMMGIAAGIALAGWRPWVYSIAPFATLRCLEQIRNDVCLHRLPVRIVGNGGGFTYGIMGATHHALEDLGVLKGLPGIVLFFPGTNDQVAAAVTQMHGQAAPGYLRLAISGFPSNRRPLHVSPRALTARYTTGGSLTVVGVGHAIQIALTALEAAGGQCDWEVFGVTKYPFEWEHETELLASVRRTRRVLVVDEHYRAGSIGESFLAEIPVPTASTLMAVQYRAGQKYGSSTFHLTQCGLAPGDIAEAARRLAAPERTLDFARLGEAA